MRLDEWQKFIESQFLEEGADEPEEVVEKVASEPPKASQTALFSTQDDQKPEPPPAKAVPIAEMQALPTPIPPVRPAEPVVPPASPPVSIPANRTAASSSSPLGFSADEMQLPAFENYLKPRFPSLASVSPPPAPRPQPATIAEAKANRAEVETPEIFVRRSPKTRARHAKNVRPENVPSGLSATELLSAVPKHVQTLLALEREAEEKEVAQYSYKRPFQEGRKELIARLLDPVLTLEETARLLNVCPTTIRRYTNKGILTYYRKEPENSTVSPESAAKETRQRRFRLSDILAFLETQQAALEADRAAENRKAVKSLKSPALPAD